ncbi:MAG: DUF6799 domain-containing protein [Ginsengibacter sp.]
MKKLLSLAILATTFAACNDATTTNDVNTDTLVTTTTTSEVNTTTYTPMEGDATYRDGTVRVWKNGDWVAADDDVTLDNGVVVYKTGEVKKDTKTVRLADGEIITRTGNFFDKTGQAIEDGWDATKRGVKKAGDAIGDAAKDVKKSIDGDGH